MSRGRIRRARSMPGWAYVLILLGVVTVAAGIPYLVASEDAKRPPNAEVLTPLTLPSGVELSSLEEARVTEVIDGDTIRARIDGREVTVRYYGVDTPERGDRCYREATDRNEQLIGDRVLLMRDSRNQDPNGRLLRYVFRPDGTSVDATLVAEGFANAWRDDGRYRNEILALERQAQAEGRGCLW